MRCYSRLLLIGLLITNMAVDCAATGRLFRRGGGNCTESSACCDRHDCCVDCPPLLYCDTSIPTSSDPCCIETMTVEEAASTCCEIDEQPFEPTIIESSPLDESNEAAATTEESPALPATPPTPAPALPPAQLAVPTVPETPVDSMPEAPETQSKPVPSVVGDRYSDDGALFDTPAPTTPEPAAPEDSTSDIFDEPEPAEEPTEDILPPSQSRPAESTPESESEEDKPKEDLDIDELFGNDQPTAAQVIPAEQSSPTDTDAEQPVSLPEELKPSAPAETENSFDPFSEVKVKIDDQTSALREAGGLYSAGERTWTDDSARFQYEAKLIRVTVKNVVLRQSSGAKVSIPFTCLSDQDLRFVHQQVVSLRLANTRDAAPTKLAKAWGK